MFLFCFGDTHGDNYYIQYRSKECSLCWELFPVIGLQHLPGDHENKQEQIMETNSLVWTYLWVYLRSVITHLLSGFGNTPLSFALVIKTCLLLSAYWKVITKDANILNVSHILCQDILKQYDLIHSKLLYFILLYFHWISSKKGRICK